MTDSPFKGLPDIPLEFVWYFPKPYHYPSTTDCLIVASQSMDEESGIYQYNLTTNQLDLLCSYKDGFDTADHGNFIDLQHNKLHIIGEEHAIFDLETNEIEYDELDEDHLLNNKYGQLSSSAPKTAYIPAPVNEIHICVGSKHFKFDPNDSNDIIELSQYNKTYPKLIYIPFNQNLMIFGSNKDDTIWNCNIQQYILQTDYEWKLNKLKMPFAVDDDGYDILLGFKNILFIFYFKCSEHCDIWLYDLWLNKLYKSQYKVPQTIDSYQNIYVVKGNHHDAHIIDFYSKKHFKVCLEDLIPNKLKDLHRNYYESLIMGYLREKEMFYKTMNIPIELKQMILTYFQLFD